MFWAPMIALGSALGPGESVAALEAAVASHPAATSPGATPVATGVDAREHPSSIPHGGGADDGGDDDSKPRGSEAAFHAAFNVVRKTFVASLGVGTVATALYLARRSRFAQMRAMKYKMKKNWKSRQMTALDHASAVIFGGTRRSVGESKLEVKVDRHKELKVLRHHFMETYPKLTFVTGPEAAGKSSITEKALGDIEYVLKVDLHKDQVSSGSLGASELLDHLCRRAGFYFPTTVLADLGIIQPSSSGSSPTKAAAFRREQELALRYLEYTCEEIVSETGQYPCIFIDELHSLKDAALTSSDFTRFLQWCMHITDSGLAHVVFVGRDTSLTLLDQEHHDLRERRIHFPVDFPIVTPELVKVALRHADKGRLFDGADEAKLLCETFGGQLRDMEKALDSADTGLSVSAAASRMVTETSHFIEQTILGPILQEVADADKQEDLEASYRRYLRCWNMLVLFSEAENGVALQHDRLIYEVFGEHGHEVEIYVDKGLLRYGWPPLGTDKTFEVILFPVSQRFHCAFRQLVNKPGLNKVAMDIKRHLAKLELKGTQDTLSERVQLVNSMKDFLPEDEVKPEMESVWKKLKENWEDYDTLSDTK
ncbi:Mitochondrial escape protein 2-like [Hondaea fermentalgiana]|uniref:Mitochondrial escape protein 2-like n=1 Tax=Hondaea fermentalgiana TaxID=2315210 RepID=A0A2R5GRV6_9STRA|nr:Mitochondrial escape protein 2-like [Hondaea fermentalgiana]|eukprot:GBG33612.1 Mitochondrial escape protein 2-like [Hondaea fermentalgiana]